MADDDRRVEARLGLVGRGSGTTPERIAELAQRQRELDKADKKKPAKAFGEHLAGGAAKAQPARTATIDGRKPRVRELKKTPRPGLVHPAQKEAFGREDEAEDPVILKG